MDEILRRYCKLLEAVMAACLTTMVVLVFGNVVLRYVFNSGITISEEVSLAVRVADLPRRRGRAA